VTGQNGQKNITFQYIFYFSSNKLIYFMVFSDDKLPIPRAKLTNCITQKALAAGASPQTPTGGLISPPNPLHYRRERRFAGRGEGEGERGEGKGDLAIPAPLFFHFEPCPACESMPPFIVS
jgi:hypothetical protein